LGINSSYFSRDVVDGKHVGGTDDEFEFQIGRGRIKNRISICSCYRFLKNKNNA